MLTGVGQQGHVPGAFHHYRHLALQFGIGPRFAAGTNTAVIADKIA